MTNPIIENFERIVRLHNCKAAYTPADQQQIEAEYQQAKRALEKLVEDAINLQILPTQIILKAE